jgi:hypothetical protein
MIEETNIGNIELKVSSNHCQTQAWKYHSPVGVRSLVESIERESESVSKSSNTHKKFIGDTMENEGGHDIDSHSTYCHW